MMKKLIVASVMTLGAAATQAVELNLHPLGVPFGYLSGHVLFEAGDRLKIGPTFWLWGNAISDGSGDVVLGTGARLHFSGNGNDQTGPYGALSPQIGMIGDELSYALVAAGGFQWHFQNQLNTKLGVTLTPLADNRSFLVDYSGTNLVGLEWTLGYGF